MTFVLKHKMTTLGIALGAIAGYFYWQQIGCASGQCAITSDPVNSTLYGAVLGGLLLNIFKPKGSADRMTIQSVFQGKKYTILDVRTRGEFQGGHVAGSMNIPLQELPQHIEEVKQLSGPLILCCASGARSSQAARLLSAQNIECYNGGSWMDVNRLQSESAQ